MSGQYNNTNPMSGYTNYTSRPIYVMAAGETRGACFDCPGKDMDKSNNYGCENCARRRRGAADCWDPTNYKERPVYTTPNSTSNLSKCEMPNCQTMTKGQFCRVCHSRRNNRRSQWRRQGNIAEAPEWFLNRPVVKNGWKKMTSKYVYHQDDKPHQAIINYDKKLAKAKSLGFRSYKEMTTKLYEKHQSLRKASEIIGITAGGLRTWLMKIGYKINSSGGANHVKK